MQMQPFGELLRATARRSATIIFAKGENANRVLYRPCAKPTLYDNPPVALSVRQPPLHKGALIGAANWPPLYILPTK